MEKMKQVAIVFLSILLLLTTVPINGIAADTTSVSINGGDFTMVPGEFSVLTFQKEESVNITDISWSVNKYNVVTVDSKTGRIDAIGSGSATITLNVTDDLGNIYEDSVEVTVNGGPTPIVEPIPELQNNNRPDFMMGADVSSLYQIMQENKKYYDLEGNEAHLFDILEENGVNWVRLRVWNDPYDEFGNPLGGGNTTIDTTIELAKQAKERGMKVFTTFHYSDFWAHPGQQIIPKAWEGLSNAELAVAVGEFTTESLNKMKDAGVYPDMVGIGNETNSDILDIPFNLDDDGVINSDAVEIFKAGAAAVRNTDPDADDPNNKTLVSFHLADGNNTWLYENFAKAMKDNDVDYDALGASYYPSWHGTYDEVLNNLNNITATYGIDAFIAETAYPWTINEDAGDDIPQNFKHGDVSTVGLSASIQGQATALREALNVAAKIDNEKGLGAFYWEPAWLAGPTTGWATPYGTGWEVANLFDINGYALPSIKTFDLVRGDQTVPADANEYAYGWETTVTVEKGSTLTMPTEILAVKNNGMMGDTKRTITKQPVVWNADDVSNVDLDRPGEYIVFGSINDIENNAFAHVIVKESAEATADAPTFSLSSGSYVDAIEDGYSASVRHLVEGGGTIELATETPNAQIAFTLDGAQPREGLNEWGWPNGQVEGATRELAGAPYIKQSDSIRVYSGPIQITQNVEINATTRRLGYNYESGKWGSDATLLNYSPTVSASYKAVYDYSDDLLLNGGFESGDLTGWDLTSDAITAEVITPDDYVTYAYAGDNSFKFTLASEEDLTLSQSLNLHNGKYKLSLYARGDNQTTDDTEMTLTASSGGEEFASTVKTVNVPGGEMIWRKYTIEDIEVKDEQLVVGFDAYTSGSYNGFIDHVVLEPIEVESADKSELETTIAEAQAIDSSLYTTESYETLKTALDSALALLENNGALQSEVDVATTSLSDAIDGLILVDKPDQDGQNEEPSDEDSNDKKEMVVVKPTVDGKNATVNTKDIETVKKDGQFVIDLKDDNSVSSVNVTKDQLELLKQQNVVISIEKEDVLISLPTSIFTGKGAVEISIEKMQSIDTALSAVYDFTIKQGDTIITEFSQKVKLTFKVDQSKVKTSDNVKVYYYNSETGDWELIGGTYQDGVITAETTHFSTYAVFEGDPDGSAQNDSDQGNVAKSGKDQEENGDKLPKTATSMYTILLIGFLMLLLGGASFFVMKRTRQ